jgi:adenylate cyclase
MGADHAERRLVAILAADIVGYSRLIEADEAGTLAAMRALRSEVIAPLLVGHHGLIVKLMGDGLVAEFGSVVEAVGCAAAVQQQVANRQENVPAERRVVLRIGVNLGDVVVEGDDLLGDGVNVAARLEQLCPPGSVLISGTAHEHLSGKLDIRFAYAGEQHRSTTGRHWDRSAQGAVDRPSAPHRATHPTAVPGARSPAGALDQLELRHMRALAIGLADLSSSKLP